VVKKAKSRQQDIIHLLAAISQKLLLENLGKKFREIMRYPSIMNFNCRVFFGFLTKEV